MYTDDKATQILIALLKEYNIKNIVISPGTRNRGFSGSVQNDNFFNVYSVIDERSAAYFASGLAYETDAPVVIACTGATASRNYLPALTEAYYRKLPIIALTCGHEYASAYSLTPQYTDRSVSQNDVKICSLTLPHIADKQSEKQCELFCNVALSKATAKVPGPVHINLLSLSYGFNTKELPNVNKITSYSTEELFDEKIVKKLSKQLENKNIGIFIGAHKKMSKSLSTSLASFIDKFNAVVFCDHTSNYNGKNKILVAPSFNTRRVQTLPDILIDMGGICGQYAVSSLFNKGEIWRISEDGEIKQRYGVIKNFFNCMEETFFQTLSKQTDNKSKHSYVKIITEETGILDASELPLSNTLVSSLLAQKLPKESSLHLSVLNSLRNMNFFNLDNSINSICNVGGFGIDGPVSTLAGQSMADSNRLFFGLIGDLAFFYDMNILGNRHIGNNLRIVLINNNLGVEFRLDASIKLSSSDINKFIAAAGHNGSAKGWAESVGFHYMSASDKEEFSAQIDEFCSSDINHFGKPVLFEIFTTPEDEVSAYRKLCGVSSQNSAKKCSSLIKAVSCLIPDKQKRREFRKKHS